ncbi:hypothetical protein AV530_006289 [Patagioenas fasciata monilis]|uniref:Uncharacterized protein n=1 Tax=Patagioenas fasciata monilis TaxID=372326 RepID=A0A1V4KG60_PATFA|nr:hypothetical protein AV530_006289 [Patagioenas fasciata monilis]
MNCSDQHWTLLSATRCGDQALLGIPLCPPSAPLMDTIWFFKQGDANVRCANEAYFKEGRKKKLRSCLIFVRNPGDGFLTSSEDFGDAMGYLSRAGALLHEMAPAGD